MDASENKNAANEGAKNDAIRVVRHDVKNQLSNIHLAIEQLRYEIPDISDDCKFYLDSIIKSSEIINKLITGIV